MAKFCSNCGAELNEEQEICLKCGVRVKNSNTKNTDPNAKSKMAAGLLGIFLGQWGVHNFYLGYTGKAVAQLLLSMFGYILLFVVVGFFMVAAAGIWGLIEGIMILSGSINTDANGNPLRDKCIIKLKHLIIIMRCFFIWIMYFVYVLELF